VNERFIRCAQCGFPHVASARMCPVTRQPIQGAAPAAPPPAPRPKPNAWAEPTRQGRPGQVPSPVSPAPGAAGLGGTTQSPGSSPDEFVGKVIDGKYKIRGVLGRGGMGTVFEAVHAGIGRQSAIKVLHTSQLRKKDAVRRFHQEAKAAARIGHPNICEVYDLGTLEDGRPYLVMEKLVGETLADAIARVGGLPFAEVVDILRQVLSGLHAAHENGIIHRDIKPENVFLTRRVGCPPVAKLLDFGVSKMMNHHPQSKDDGDMEMTRTGIVLGTPYYLAPEQARGDRNLDARVDLYACGVMLYEAITGKRPFIAANYNALLLQILTGAPRPIHELRQDTPDDLARIVMKAMSRDKGQRYESAIDFQSDLPGYDAMPGPPSRPPAARPSAPPAGPSAGETPLRATRVGLPPAPSAMGSHTRAAPPRPGPSEGRAAPLNALPVAPPFTSQGAPGATQRGPFVGAAPPASRKGSFPEPDLSSSQEVDALMSDETPSSSLQALPLVSRVKGGPAGFEDQPTEVLPPAPFLDDASTAQMDGEEAAEARGPTSRRAPHPPSPSALRRPTLLARKSRDFSDESKTDVMGADMRVRMHQVRQVTPPPGPGPSAPSTSARSRKR
jgi:serine/threonine protein kinase